MCTDFPTPALGLSEIFNAIPQDCLTSKERWSQYEDGPDWDGIDLGTLQSGIGRNADTPRESVPQSVTRTAVVLRAWDDFRWTADDIRNVRAMVSELAEADVGEYQIFILLHLRHAPLADIDRDKALQRMKPRFVPESMVNTTEIWTYSDVATAYPKVGEYE